MRNAGGGQSGSGRSVMVNRITRRDAKMPEQMALSQSQVLAAQRWMEDEAGMERASLSPAEYVAYRMKVPAAVAQALVAAVHALEEKE
jgi:ABC-type glutathione transport system ATPase component